VGFPGNPAGLADVLGARGGASRYENDRPRGALTVRLVSTSRGEASSDDPLRHVDALYRVALRLTRRPADAEDLVQETYARALRAEARYMPGTNRRAWLFRVLRNVFLDARRREARGLPVDPDGDPDLTADGDASSDGWLRGDAELEHLRRVVGEEIEEALRSLPEPQRMVVLLDAEGLDEGEIADVLGCPAGTVKSRLHRARAALRERLAEYGR
jgi:RNA polymerase sigma-70 factor (ECF subfamily)